MDDQNKNTNNPIAQIPPNQTGSAVPPVAPPVTEQPMAPMPIGSTPSVVAPATNPGAPATPTVEKKSKALLFVALILIILIIAVGVLYYLNGQQSSSESNKAASPSQVVVQPTTVPLPTPTITPSDDQVLDTPLEDSTIIDSADLNQVSQGL